MRKFFKTLLFLSSTVLLSCGFKIVDQSNVGSFNIMEITSSGNKSINHKLKNKLTISSKNNNKRPIIIDLNTTKTKKIKEKNIKNEITKYEVSISTTVKAANINNQKSIDFLVIKSGSYNVNDKHSVSLRNEKKLINSLTDELSDKIVNELDSRINDL